MNVSQKLIASHLVDGEMTPGEEIGLKIDQTLTQDATGTMVMLELEAMQARRRADGAVGPVCRSQPVARGLQESGRSSVLAKRVSAIRHLVQPPWKRRQPPGAPGAFRQARERRSWAPTVTPARPARSACSRSARVAWKWRWRWSGMPFYVKMPADLGRRADGPTAGLGERRRMSFSKCSAATASKAEWAASSSTTARD